MWRPVAKRACGEASTVVRLSSNESTSAGFHVLRRMLQALVLKRSNAALMQLLTLRRLYNSVSIRVVG